MSNKQNQSEDSPPGRQFSSPDSAHDSVRRADARRVIIESLGNQILLTARLLEGIKEARAVQSIETELIEEAWRVCRELIETGGRLPELRAEKSWIAIERSVEHLRSALREIGGEGHVPKSVDSSFLESGLRLSLENETLRRENAVLRRENEALRKQIQEKR